MSARANKASAVGVCVLVAGLVTSCEGDSSKAQQGRAKGVKTADDAKRSEPAEPQPAMLELDEQTSVFEGLGVLQNVEQGEAHLVLAVESVDALPRGIDLEGVADAAPGRAAKVALFGDLGFDDLRPQALAEAGVATGEPLVIVWLDARGKRRVVVGTARNPSKLLKTLGVEQEQAANPDDDEVHALGGSEYVQLLGDGRFAIATRPALASRIEDASDEHALASVEELDQAIDRLAYGSWATLYVDLAPEAEPSDEPRFALVGLGPSNEALAAKGLLVGAGKGDTDPEQRVRDFVDRMRQSAAAQPVPPYGEDPGVAKHVDEYEEAWEPVAKQREQALSEHFAKLELRHLEAESADGTVGFTAGLYAPEGQLTDWGRGMLLAWIQSGTEAELETLRERTSRLDDRVDLPAEVTGMSILEVFENREPSDGPPVGSISGDGFPHEGTKTGRRQNMGGMGMRKNEREGGAGFGRIGAIGADPYEESGSSD